MTPLYALQGGVYSGIKVFYASYGGERQVLVRLFKLVYTRQLAYICLWRFCEIGSLLLIGLLATGTIAKAQAQLIAAQFASRTKSANAWLSKGHVYAWCSSAKTARSMDDGACQDAGDP